MQAGRAAAAENLARRNRMSQPELSSLFGKFPELQTERLRLRRITAADAADLFSIYSNQKVMEFYDIYPLDNLDQASKIVDRWERRYLARKAIRWGLCLKDDRKIIGTIGLRLDGEYKAALGYDLAQNYWKLGYMTEALHQVLDCSFQRTGLERLEALVIPGNHASAALLQRVGFEREGLLRHYAYFKDAHQNLQCYSMLRSDWLGRTRTEVD
jgi:ribosomal-protein-alanine N-acetyltransferase